MDDNKIEEIESPSLEEPISVEPPEENLNTDLMEPISLINTQTDLEVIHNKRVELDDIQQDLDDLMGRLNTFIADSQDDCGCVIDDIPLDFMTLDDDDEIKNVTEKQDGPPEKELRLTACASGATLTNLIYTNDGINPPAINWDAVGPILQKHVSDLQKLHNLNQMTNAVVKRIRNVTQINDALLEQVQDKEDDA